MNPLLPPTARPGLSGSPLARVSPRPAASALPVGEPAADGFDVSRAERAQTGSNRSWLFGGVALATLAVAPSAVADVQVVREEWKQPGSLVLSDYFGGDMPHGEIVARSARQVGFRGDIVHRQVAENSDVRWNNRIDSYLDQRQFTPDEMRAFLDRYATTCVTGGFDTARADLEAVIAQGMHHSAFNLSRGCGVSQIVDSLYQRVQPALNGNPGDAAAVRSVRSLRKIAPALDSDADAVLSNQPGARLHFQNALIARVDGALKSSPAVAQAEQSYTAAVRQLESRHVSVVVAAANSGEILTHMASDNGGTLPTISEGFWHNRLGIPEATVVGAAARSGDGTLQPTRYSNPDPLVRIFADGDAFVDPDRPDVIVSYGTSFSTPRVGGVMAETHRRHPDWSSDQVEQFLAGQLSETLSGSGRPVLDSARANSYMNASK